ncbi:MAG: hypothetical protein ACOYKE_13660 [Ferruginibacter sp.]
MQKQYSTPFLLISSFKRLILSILIIIFTQTQLFAFIHPSNGSQLTQIHLMFEWNEIPQATKYECSIWKIDTLTQKKSKLKTITSSSLSFLETTVLQFNCTYAWQVKAYHNNQLLHTDSLRHFQILTTAAIQPNYFKTEINFNQKPHQEIIFIDHLAIAMDKTGKPIWFLPIPTDSLSKWIFRDLKQTPFGTISYIDINGAYEKSLSGNVIWQAPNDGLVSKLKTEDYHHDFTKNKDGSFTVCGSYYLPDNKGKYSRNTNAIRYNTLIHYNADKTIQWSWNEWNSLNHDSIFKSNYNINNAGHLNGFAFTKDQRNIWMSFKNFSDVYLYNIDSNKFISSLKHSISTNPVYFEQQHGPSITKQNEILIYNNNISENDDGETKVVKHPSIMLFEYLPQNRKSILKWTYTITSKKYPEGIAGKEGYVSATTKGNFLVCPGGANFLAEITKSKAKIWECYFYKKTAKDTAWKSFTNYRCQIASSLYPLYFTLQKLNQNKQQSTFRLHNAGTENGQYKLEFYNEKDALIATKYSTVIAANDYEDFKLANSKLEKAVVRCVISTMHVKEITKTYKF